MLAAMAETVRRTTTPKSVVTQAQGLPSLVELFAGGYALSNLAPWGTDGGKLALEGFASAVIRWRPVESFQYSPVKRSEQSRCLSSCCDMSTLL